MEKLKNEIATLQAKKDEIQQASGGFSGFTEKDKLRAIEDLVKFQEKSMQIMTESSKGPFLKGQ